MSTQLLLGRVPEGVKDLEKASALSPDSDSMWFNLAEGLLRSERWAEAEQCWSRYLGAVPADAQAYERRAFARGRLGCTDRAIEDTVKAGSILYQLT